MPDWTFVRRLSWCALARGFGREPNDKAELEDPARDPPSKNGNFSKLIIINNEMSPKGCVFPESP